MRVTRSSSALNRFVDSLLASAMASTAGVATRRLFLGHEWILVVDRGRKRLLDVPGAHPANEIENGARLVVSTGSSRAAEWLLSNDSTCRLVVDVEVSGGISECRRGGAHGGTIAREDRTGESVRRRRIHRGQRFVPLLVGIDMGGHDGTEN